MKKSVILFLVAAGATAAVLWFTSGKTEKIQPQQNVDVTLRPYEASTVRRGKTLYAEQCASCHGANMEGQPNWRQRKEDGRLPAPPHDASGHTWHHPDQMLFALTKYGPGALIGDASYQSDMPAYEGILSDEEIVAVLSYIKSRWPEQIQMRHDMMQKQRAE